MSQTRFLPKVAVVSTGGTIANAGESARKGAEGLLYLQSIPGLTAIARTAPVYFCDITSPQITTALALQLRRCVAELLKDKEVEGVVVCHGTDTLEETAFLLDLTLQTEKPVVFTGAMRRPSNLVTDGPANLYNAVKLVLCKAARDRGVLICMNDRISSAYYACKTNATSLDAFQCPEAGFLGCFLNNEPHFWYGAARPTDQLHFDIGERDVLPHVPIFYAYQDCEQDLWMFRGAIEQGAKGIVLAAYGFNSSAVVHTTLDAIYAQGIPVVLSTRCGNSGMKLAALPHMQWISAGRYSPQKAKMVLQLTLATKPNDLQAVIDAFAFR